MTTFDKEYFHLSHRDASKYTTRLSDAIEAFKQNLDANGSFKIFEKDYFEKEYGGNFNKCSFDPEYLQAVVKVYLNETSNMETYPIIFESSNNPVFIMKRKKYLITQTFESVCLFEGTIIWEYSIAVSIKDKDDKSEKDLFDIFLTGEGGDPCIIGTYSSSKLNFVIEKLMDFMANNKYVFTMPKEDFLIEKPTAVLEQSLLDDKPLVPIGTN